MTYIGSGPRESYISAGAERQLRSSSEIEQPSHSSLHQEEESVLLASEEFNVN
jgi:hypothetical protein